MTVISRFDPWRCSLCTCPPKLTFNPYTGCDHLCIYCYAYSYIPNFTHCRPKKNLLKDLQREAGKFKGETISISNSSDPYPRLEADIGLTRKCLKILSQSHCHLQIITKSNLVVRDVDLLSEIPTTVAVTITTDEDDKARLIEPNAPSPTERLKTVENLIRKGIPVSVRVDPVIPFLNDNFHRLVSTLANIGVKHITSSTLKVKGNIWKRFALAVPQVAERLKPLYFSDCEKLSGYRILPKAFRLKLLNSMRNTAKAYGVQFGVCRENLVQLNTAPCDGSWLMPAKKKESDHPSETE